jgi:hypothetical protein
MFRATHRSSSGAQKAIKNTGIINCTTRSHLVGYFYTILLSSIFAIGSTQNENFPLIIVVVFAQYSIAKHILSGH